MFYVYCEWYQTQLKAEADQALYNMMPAFHAATSLQLQTFKYLASRRRYSSAPVKWQSNKGYTPAKMKVWVIDYK